MKRWIFVLFLLFVGLSLAQCEFIKIAAGSAHTVALKSDGTVWAWGNNAFGQLGNGTTEDAYLPTQVIDATGFGVFEGAIDIACGAGHTLILSSDSTVWTYGSNRYGELGDGTSTGYWTPNPLPRQVIGPDSVGYLTGIIAIACGDTHSLALKSDSTVWTWGANWWGQLGDGTTSESATANPIPRQVVGTSGVGYLTEVIAIEGGNRHSMALRSDGTVCMWGANWYGTLGDGTSVDTNTPVFVVGIGGAGVLSDITEIACNMKPLALRTDNKVLRWGAYQRTPVYQSGPVGTGDFTNIVSIATGRNHHFAISSDSLVYAWGVNYFGQLGDGTEITSSSPIFVLSPDGTGILSGISLITGGEYHSVAIKSDGTLWAWGRNNHGQLGDGTITNSSIPVRVLCEDVEIDFSRGWNLVSVPTVEPQHSSIFSTSAFGYDPSMLEYFTADSLHPGKGYFVLSMDTDTVELPRTLHSYSDTLHRGWNLIGAVNIPLPASSIETDPPGLIIPPLFGWDGADYFIADTLYPGRGYWLLSSENGRIEVGP